MRITRRQVRRIILEYFKGKQPLPSDRAFMQRGVRDLGVVHAGPMRNKKQPSGDARKAAQSTVEKLRFALTKIPFKNVRELKDTIEMFGVDPDDEYAWYEWHQQTEGGMDSWFVKNRLSDYAPIPTSWPKRWLKRPGQPQEGFDS